MFLHLIVIDEELRSVLYNLEIYLNIKLDEAVIDRIFTDSEEQVQTDEEKCYTLYKSSDSWFAWVIEGIVEAQEPETIWFQSRFGFHKQKNFEAFFKNKP
jgi:hypothetical protein